MIKKSSAGLQATLRTAVVCVVLTAAGSASAATVGELYPADQQSQTAAATPATAAVKTRAQVIDELVQARAAGQFATGEVGYAFGTPAERDARPGKRRTEVVAEYRQAAADGTLVTHGEVESTPATTTATALAGSARSRAEVRADAVRSARSSVPVGNTFGGH